MPGGTALSEPHQHSWTQRCVDGWSDLRDFGYGLRVAWVSTASAAIGLILYLKASQAQDLFLEVKGHFLSDTLFWAGFYLAVVLAWALPVFVSARWILVRFEEGPHAHPRVLPVKTWVRRRVPLLLGATCLLAIGVGQLIAMRNAPTVHDATREDIQPRIESAVKQATKLCQRAPSELQTALCVVRAVPDVLTTIIGQSIAENAGRENVPHVAYVIAAYVMLWFLFVRPSPSPTQVMSARYARRVVLTLASLTSLTMVAWPLFFLFIWSTGFDVTRYAWHSLAVPALSLVIVGFLAWRGMERSLWWLGTISATPIAVLVLFGFYAYVSFELESAFGLAHLVLLPATTVVIGILLWWLLAPFSDGRASRAGQLLHRLRGGTGQIDEDQATLRFIDPLFVLLLVLTVAVILILVAVHPLHVTESLRLHRAILLPVILGMPVALFTYITHWSARVRGPLIFAAIFAVAAIGVIWGDNHAMRIVQRAPPRIDLKEAVTQWVSVNSCKDDHASCPAPVIIAAAGGASRSAFHVAGVIGNLLDEQRFSPLRGHSGFVMTASFAPDFEGTRIVTASRDNTARIWDGITGQLIRGLRSSESLMGAKFSPDAKLVVTASDDKAATIWDAESGTVIRKLEPHDAGVNSAEFNRDGSLIVTSSKDKLARIWRTATGELLQTFSGHRSGVNSAVFHPDATKIASGSNDGTIRVWDVATGQELYLQQMRHDGAVQSVAFSPDGKRLVSASDDETARVWDPETGKQLQVLEGHYGRVHSASFSGDATKIITGSWDKTFRVWDAVAYKELKVLRAHSSDINSAAFSRDGERIVTASDDGTARVWDARTYERYPWRVTTAHPFGNQLFAVSAVSGGSLGAVLTYAALADTQRENLTGTGIGLPPCTTEGMRDEDWFGAPVRGQQVQPANPVQSWRDCLQLLSAGDFLSPVFVSLLSNDPLRIGLRGNRAVVLEHAWEARYARLTSQEDGLGIMFKQDGDTTLAQSLATVRQKAAGRGIWLPILLLNGTSVETGRRIVTSDVDTLVRDADGRVTDRVFADSYDLHELFFRPVKEKIAAGKNAASTPNTKAGCQECDIRLSTAATMSARFPLISPPGGIIGKDGKNIIDRVVDGGYYENFGATTAMELATALRLRHPGLPKPIIILISNDPHTSQMECVTRVGLDYPRSASTPWFPTFSSPLDALLGTRNARATHAAVNLCKADRERFIFVSVNLDRANPDKDLSMSWWLSKHVQKYLDEQIDERINILALDKMSPQKRSN